MGDRTDPGELLKLGIKVTKHTIQRYLPKRRKKSSQTWATFLKNHAAEIWACDFTVVHDLFFRPTYIFIIIGLHARWILHPAVTLLSPNDDWTAQQLCEANPWGKGPKYLIHDRNRKCSRKCAIAAASSGIQELGSPIRAPNANAICERIIGRLKREYLDHVLVWHTSQVRRLVKDYVIYSNRAHPHQGIEQRIPEQYAQTQHSVAKCPKTRIISLPVLGGLHQHYHYIPRLN